MLHPDADLDADPQQSATKWRSKKEENALGFDIMRDAGRGVFPALAWAPPPSDFPTTRKRELQRQLQEGRAGDPDVAAGAARALRRLQLEEQWPSASHRPERPVDQVQLAREDSSYRVGEGGVVDFI